jgi:hypothetical protein
MPFEVKNEVFVVTVCDTGQVTEIAGSERNTVAYDELPGSGAHHDTDLRLIPFEGRIYKADFYYIVHARRDGTRRFHETICVRNSGGRIFTKRSRK